MISAPLISRWSFGVLVLMAASPGRCMGLSDPNPVPPDAKRPIWLAVRGYCSCSTRNLWAPAHEQVTPTRSVSLPS
ncbi:hypothetical protein T01_14433 [Trichinella spiralis]|uniref:Secreted protein n=1 Tax=Trichinella spiralis TaxID=6334 RepID=A0A0V1B7L6_TRISP|nr:hypothetical protein T01_14433 [Trichinella spiralis]